MAPPSGPADRGPAQGQESRPTVGTWLAGHLFPDIGTLPGRQKVIAAVMVVLLAIVGAVTALLWDVQSESLTADTRAEIEDAAADALDQKRTPLVARTEYDSRAPLFGRIVLDRPLTADEEDFIQAQALDAEALENAWEFFRHRGGRLLRYPSAVVDGSQADAQAQHEKSFWSDSTTFTMNLFSDRNSPVTVTDMRAVEISCVAPTAQTLIEYPPEGNEAYAGVLFDLSKPDRGPVITDNDDRGRPFFEKRKVDLGGGLSPGGLRVEAVTTRRSCRWKIEATYQNSSQGGATLILDDEGEPFFAEATPPRPRQHWTTGIGDDNLVRRIPCHEQPSAADCRGRADAFR